MLRGPKCLTPWVDLRCHQYPENGLLAGLGWGFHPKITLWSRQKTGVTKLFFIYVKRAKAKTMPYRTLGFPEYGMTNASNFKWGFTPDSNPNRGNTKMGNKIDINLWECAKAKKQCHSLPYSVLRIWNDQCEHFKCGFTPESHPKMGKKGVTTLLFIYVK